MLSWANILLIICFSLPKKTRWKTAPAVHGGSHPLLLLHGIVGWVTSFPLRARPPTLLLCLLRASQCERRGGSVQWNYQGGLLLLNSSAGLVEGLGSRRDCLVLNRWLLWKLWGEDCHVIVVVEGALVLVSWLLLIGEVLHAASKERLRWRSYALRGKEGRGREARNGYSCLLLCS